MSLRLQEAVSLKPFNTFAVDAKARLFAEAHDDGEVREALAESARRGLPLMPIGGGSNLLLTGDVEALVLRMASRGPVYSRFKPERHSYTQLSITGNQTIDNLCYN